jgi:hypothetical protein
LNPQGNDLMRLSASQHRRNGTHVVLAAELLRESRGHDLAADGRGSGEVRLARLAPGGGDVCSEANKRTYVRQHFVLHIQAQ